MANTACFIIVGRNDIPIYEAEVGSAPKVLFLSFLIHILMSHLDLNYIRWIQYTLLLSLLFTSAVDMKSFAISLCLKSVY